MKVFELLTILNKPRYTIEVYDRSDLRGGTFKQGKLKVDLLNREVSKYIIYKTLRVIEIYVKENEND